MGSAYEDFQRLVFRPLRQIQPGSGHTSGLAGEVLFRRGGRQRSRSVWQKVDSIRGRPRPRSTALWVTEGDVVLARHVGRPSAIYVLEMTRQYRGSMRVRYVEVLK